MLVSMDLASSNLGVSVRAGKRTETDWTFFGKLQRLRLHAAMSGSSRQSRCRVLLGEGSFWNFRLLCNTCAGLGVVGARVNMIMSDPAFVRMPPVFHHSRGARFPPRHVPRFPHRFRD